MQVRSVSHRSPLPPQLSAELVRGLWAGVFGVGALTLLKLLFRASIGDPSPFLLYFGAVLLAAWYGGRAAGLAITVLCGAIGGAVFIPDPLAELWSRTVPQVALFALEGVTIALLTARLADERRRAFVLAGEAGSSSAQLDVVLSSVDEGITLVDPRGVIVYANQRAAELCGYPDADALLRAPPGEVLARFELFDEHGAVFPVEQLPGRLVVQGRVPAERVVRFRERGGGTEHWAALRASAVRDERGEIRFIVNMFRDVSEPRRAALEHERLFAHLEHTRAEAVRANRAKDEFLAMLGHELRNPLAPILTTLELMKLRSPETFAQERAVIERQLAYVVRLVDDLLDVSRITEGRVELHKTRVDVADAIEHAIEMSRPLYERRRHALTVSVERGLLVSADRARLAQVVSNLLTNAAKYTEPGGHIDVSAQREPGPDDTAARVVIRVRDDGVGIVPEALPNLFDAFVQGPQAMDRAQGGLGLGLTIVRSLVALHSGTVSVHSDGPGKGSEFVVSLPERLDAAPPSDEVTPTRTEPPAREPGLRVLLVDDNQDALDLLAALLGDMGHEVHTADNAHDALELAARVQPELGVLDIGLPEIDGYELARRLHAMAGLATLPLIALSGYGQAGDRARTRETGFVEHLVKPATAQQIRSAIAAARRPAASE